MPPADGRRVRARAVEFGPISPLRMPYIAPRRFSVPSTTVSADWLTCETISPFWSNSDPPKVSYRFALGRYAWPHWLTPNPLERIMLSTLFWICVGIFIGWNLPQPHWARSLQNRVVAAIKGPGSRRRR